MAQYYATRPSVRPQRAPPTTVNTNSDGHVLSEFDKLRETLLTDDAEEGWMAELRRYLGSMQRDVTKDTDLVIWWQVSFIPKFCYLIHIQ